MKLVIDIPEETFVELQKEVENNRFDMSVAKLIISQGKPIEDGRPTLIYKGQVVYLTQEHIEVLADYDRKSIVREVLDDYYAHINDWQTEMRKDYSDVIADFKGKPISGTVYQDSFCPNAHNCIEYFGSHCADRCPLKKENTNGTDNL